MPDEHPTQAQLIQEVQQLRQRVAELEALQAAPAQSAPTIDVLTKYQLLAAVARDVLLFVRARDGRILEANRAAEEIYGYTRAELLNMTIYDLRAPATRAGVAAQLNQADFQGITFETLHRRRDGHEFPVEVNSGGVMLGDDRILLSIARDITERKQAEAQREATLAALRQSEERFSKTFFNAPVALSLTRITDGHIFEVNDRFTDLFEYRREEMLGRTSLELNMYPDPSERAVLLERMQREGFIRDHELMIQTHSGALRRVLISSIAVTLNDDTCVLTTLIDMTDRQRLEAQREAALTALSQSEERFSKSFFNAPVAFCLTRMADGRFFEINERFADLVGYSRDDILGRTTLELGLYPDPDERERLRTQLREHGFVREHELTVRTRSGALRQTLLSSVTVTLNDEESILSTLIDMTERKEMERALQDLNANLEERVQARTAELQIATNRLLELDRLKDEFISRINHELRTPLSILQIHLALLKTGQVEKREQYLMTVQQQTQRLRALIEDLLKINQLTTDKIEPDLRASNLNALIEPQLPAWHEIAAQHGLIFNVELANALPPAFIDPELIMQVIAQLVHNAVSYTQHGTITLCTAQRVRAQQSWVVVSVADTGPGIASDELPHIFERFYRGRAAANYKTPGTGVGLSISRDIVALLHGEITVESEVKQGSRFTLWLPICVGCPD